MWKFDPILVDIVWVSVQTELIFDGLVSFGFELNGDLELSCGLRENESSIFDSGSRVIETEG